MLTNTEMEAVKLLIQQFRADQLDNLLKTELLVSLKNTFICLKPTEAETTQALGMLLDLWHREELAPEEADYITRQTMRPWGALLDNINTTINPMAHTQEDRNAPIADGVRHPHLETESVGPTQR